MWEIVSNFVAFLENLNFKGVYKKCNLEPGLCVSTITLLSTVKNFKQSSRIASHTTPIMELLKKKPVAQTSWSSRTFLLANT